MATATAYVDGPACLVFAVTWAGADRVGIDLAPLLDVAVIQTYLVAIRTVGAIYVECYTGCLSIAEHFTKRSSCFSAHLLAVAHTNKICRSIADGSKRMLFIDDNP